MIKSLPHSPTHSVEWIEKFFSKNYYKKPYNKFMWWRSYTPKNIPLTNRHPFRDRILNGDFDIAPYRIESELAEHTINKKYIECTLADGSVDHGRFNDISSIDRSRRKRLLEDYDKEELRRLEELRSGFITEFKITKDQYDMEVVETRADELIDFYYELEEKYGKWARPLKKVPKF